MTGVRIIVIYGRSAARRFYKRMFMLEKIIKLTTIFYIFLLPWQARYIFAEYSLSVPFYGGLAVYITDILFALLVILWIWWGITEKVFHKTWKRMMSTKANRIIILFSLFFLLFALASVIWSPDMQLAFPKWIRVLQAGLLISILLTTSLKSRAIFLAVIGAGILQGLLAIDQFFAQEIIANTFLGVSGQNPQDLGVSVIEFGKERWLRSYGSLPHPNILGGFLAIAALCSSAWYFSVYEQMKEFVGKWDKVTIKQLKPIRLQIIASLSSFTIILIGMLLTFSRSAWLAFAIGWLALFLSLFFATKKKVIRILFLKAGSKLVITGVLIFAALNLLLGPLWTARLNDTSRLGMVSVTQRSDLINQAKILITESPALGLGIGSYLLRIQDLNPGRDIFFYQPVHNTWLLLWAELGIVGLSLFFLWIAFIFYWIQKLIKSKSIIKINEALVLSVLITIGIIAYFEHFWWTLLFGIMFLSIWLALFLKQIISEDTK